MNQKDGSKYWTLYMYHNIVKSVISRACAGYHLVVCTYIIAFNLS